MEQQYNKLKSRTWRNFNGGPDGSGPYEIKIPRTRGVDDPKEVLSEFQRIVDFNEDIWEWKGELDDGRGCGCHFHLRPIYGNFQNQRELNNMSNSLQQTMLWNTLVPLVPILAPFWSWNWITPPFRGSRSDSGVARWAKRVGTRYTQSTMAERWMVNRPRNLRAVTFSPARGLKPRTIEVRMPEAHPTQVMTGVSIIQKILFNIYMKWQQRIALQYPPGERDVTPRIRGVVNGEGEIVLSPYEYYTAIYSLDQGIYNLNRPLRESMKFPFSPNHYIEFNRGREIPWVSSDIPSQPNRFRDLNHIFTSILEAYTGNSGVFVDRVAKLALSHYHPDQWDLNANPPRNNQGYFEAYLKAPGEFRWAHGPEVL